MFSVFSQNKRSKRVLHFAEDNRTLCGQSLGVGSGFVRDGDYRNNVVCPVCAGVLGGYQSSLPYYIDPIHSAASTIGRLGGLVKSEAKSTSSRANGRKGGRPKSTQSKSIDMGDI